MGTRWYGWAAVPTRAGESGPAGKQHRDALNTRFDNSGPCLDELVFVEQASDRLRHALNDVPERARQAFLLHRLEGLSHDKIARQLGVTTRIVERDVAAVVEHLTRILFASEGS